MKRIVIFLASSIEDLREDRLVLGDYFLGLNHLYRGSGIEFELVKCEYCDDALSAAGKQLEYDERIRESDLCFFLIFHRVGKYTRHEFDVAWEAFQTRKRPQIVTYFKNVKDGETIEENVASFLSMLQDSLGQYPGRYDHVDTVKLNMLMKINRLTLNSADISIRNGEVYVNGEAVAESKNIPLLDGNGAIRSLMERKQACERVVEKARACRDQDPSEENDDLLYEARKELARVSKELTDTEKEMLTFASTVEEMTSDGRVLTHRQKEALEYYEVGEYRKAKQRLESKERENELERAKLRIASGRDCIKGYIEESLLWIQAEMVGSLTQSSAEKIIERYRIIEQLIDEYRLSPGVLYAYASFLMRQKRMLDAISVAQKLQWYYAKPGYSVEMDQKARLLDLLGVLYHETNQPKEAEQMHRDALKIWEELSADGSGRYDVDLALSYNNMGELYHDLKRYEKAEEWYLLAFRIWERVVAAGNEKYEANLAGSYNNLGILCTNLGRPEEAESQFHSAIQIRQRLARKNPDVYEPDLAKVYNNLGLLYVSLGRYEEAEEMYHAALTIRQRLAVLNPEVFETNVAKIYHNIGNLYGKKNDWEEAERMYRCALEIRMHLAAKNPEVYLPELASSYRSLGSLQEQKGEYEEAERAYALSIETYGSLAMKSPDTFEPSLAYALRCMGHLHQKQGKAKEAKDALTRALELYCQYEKRNPGHYAQDIDSLQKELTATYT